MLEDVAENRSASQDLRFISGPPRTTFLHSHLRDVPWSAAQLNVFSWSLVRIWPSRLTRFSHSRR